MTLIFLFLFAVLVSSALTILIGKKVIPLLHKLKFGQFIREDGPQAHLKKGGTPTIGGVIFMSSIFIMTIVVVGIDLKSLYPLLGLICFGVIGLLDDVLKIKKKTNEGLTSKQKMIALIIVGCVLAIIAKNLFGTSISLWGDSYNLGHFYIPFITFLYIAVTNAVNITDGVDGLATTVTMVVLIFMFCLSRGNEDLTMFISISVGALFGFLQFNKNPAKVFMGDTGSLGIGGMLVSISIVIGTPFILIPLGIIYIIETLSVIIQVISFKKFGKRVFKMSPIHHHLELSGYSETKIVQIAWIITAVGGFFTLV